MRFRIGFDDRDREKLHRYWDTILDRDRWSGGPFTERFEGLWSESCGLPAVALSSWSGAARIVMEFYGLRKVAVPSNTFMATPLAVLKHGAQVAWVDCNRHDLCMSADHLMQVARENPGLDGVILVHIGGHLAFDADRIARFCEQHHLALIEDCAHAHGASWHGRSAGRWGDCGIFSFYATKTVSTGEGAMLVSRDRQLIEYARAYRDYGKPDYRPLGQNFRMSEFQAAVGCVVTERLPEVVEWKNEYARKHLDPRFENRLRLPYGMVSGLYKYVVFDRLAESTGRVYDPPCHRILGSDANLPDTDWVAANHSCVPLYYQGAEL